MATYYPYSLDTLPLTEMTSALQKVSDAKANLTTTQAILQGIAKMPTGLTSDLKQGISNIGFHVDSALAAIDQYLATGGVTSAPFDTVTGLADLIAKQVAATNALKPAWKAWLKDAYASGVAADGQLPRLIDEAAAPVASGGLMSQISKPLGTTDYLSIAGVALLGYALWKAFK